MLSVPGCAAHAANKSRLQDRPQGYRCKRVVGVILARAYALEVFDANCTDDRSIRCDVTAALVDCPPARVESDEQDQSPGGGLEGDEGTDGYGHYVGGRDARHGDSGAERRAWLDTPNADLLNALSRYVGVQYASSLDNDLQASGGCLARLRIAVFSCPPNDVVVHLERLAADAHGVSCLCCDGKRPVAARRAGRVLYACDRV